MKNKLSTILLVLVFFLGLSLLLYPIISQAWNDRLQSGLVGSYQDSVSALDTETAARLRAEAQRWNEELLSRPNRFALTDEQTEQYQSLLSLSDTSPLAYLEIPAIGVSLPVLHGTSDTVLSKAVGHLEWSSLPVGGESTHCVLSGHRGLPSSELLTNIDHLEVGDVFYLHVLGERLEYRVDRISVVEPSDISLLSITPGRDYVTLVTCTPYGINSHRLLVRGIRVAQNELVDDNNPGLKNEVSPVDTGLLIALTLAAILIAAFVLLLMGVRPKRKRGGKRLQKRTHRPRRRSTTP